MKKVLSCFKWSKIIIQALYEKIEEKACQAGKSVKSYLADEKNIRHVSLIAYDLLPFSVKIGLRYDKFHEQFAKIFVMIRKQLFNYDDEVKAENETQVQVETPVAKTASAAKKVARKVVAKKAPAKKTVKTPVAKKVVAKKTRKSVE
jgi:hypothetical protein